MHFSASDNPIKQRNMVKVLRYFEHIGCLIYELLIYICKDNRENEVECFKYVDIFKKQAGYGLGVTNCIISMFSNNEMLLYSLYSNQNFYARGRTEDQSALRMSRASNVAKINEDTSLIYFFINQLKGASSRFHLDILKFLSAACKFEDQGITVNQNLINSMLFESKELKSIAFLPISCKDDKIYFEVTDPAVGRNVSGPL